MIAVSSLRPFSDPNSEHGRNQIRAHRSWVKAFQIIVYFNDPQPGIESDNTIFVPAEEYPKILELAGFCGLQTDWCAILNADIVIGDRFPVIERRLKRSPNACAGVSWRYEYDPAADTLEAARIVDNGLDFFCASPDIWNRASVMLHPEVRIGAQSWDTQMLSFLSTFALHGFYDLTPARVVFHPRHGNRRYGPCVAPDKIRVWGAPVMPHASIA